MTNSGSRWGRDLLLIMILVFLCSSAAYAGSSRWAVVAGNNHGGNDRLVLRYAEKDAKRVARVLRELGHFPEEQIRILLDSTPDALLDTLGDIQRTERPSLLLVFYSGHADGEHLLMGEEKLGLQELKRSVSALPADVALIILDACNSGSAVREKGGHSAPSFLRFTDSHRARGRVILTSASASELAQESDEIGSSFFTHYLVSGLMGDADRSGDSRISLAELYRYTYDRTVSRTMDTLSGVQHPSFSYDLKGEGSIVLTDLNTGSTGIILPRPTEGTYLLYDQKKHTVVAEVQKSPGEERLIPLSPGTYTLKKRLNRHLLVADVEVKTNARVTVSDGQMQSVDFEFPNAKGWDLALRLKPSRFASEAVAGWCALLRAPAGGIWSFPVAGVAFAQRGWPARHFVSRLALTGGAWRHAFQIDNERIPFTLLQIGADFSIGRALEYGPYHTEIGGRTSLLFLQRRFDHLGLARSDEAIGFGLGPYAQAAVRLGRVRLALEIGAGCLAFPTADRSLIPYLTGGIVLGLGL